MSSKKQPQGNIMQLDHKDTPTSPSAFTRTTMFLSSFGSYNISSSNNNSSSSMMNQSHRHHHQDPLIVLGFNLSHFSPKIQFYICASGVFSFTIIYGYLQEFLSVNILGRKHALFLNEFSGLAAPNSNTGGTNTRRVWPKQGASLKARTRTGLAAPYSSTGVGPQHGKGRGMGNDAVWKLAPVLTDFPFDGFC